MASCVGPGSMNNSQDKVTRLVLQGLERRAQRWGDAGPSTILIHG